MNDKFAALKEKKAMRQWTEILRQNTQELKTKLQTEQSLCVQEQVEAAEMEETLGQQEELKCKGEVIYLLKKKCSAARSLGDQRKSPKQAQRRRIAMCPPETAEPSS